MSAYYNEIDPYAAQWLRNLIAADHIAPGDVDERSIVDVRPDDLAGYNQCHFFAGIGGWSYALRLARWADDRPVWTGSCPCQPFSQAGKRKGIQDKRHLWPEFHRLIGKCRPAVVFGEQVASSPGWLDIVRGDLEADDFACATAEIPATGVGAKHVRYRVWYVAHPNRSRLEGIHETRGGEHLQSTPAVISGHDWKAHPEVHRSIDGISARLDKPASYREAITGLGNAIVPQVAAEFIAAFMETQS